MICIRNKKKYIKVSVIIKYNTTTFFYIGFPRNPIKITLPDGAVKEGTSFDTSPFSIASAISK